MNLQEHEREWHRRIEAARVALLQHPNHDLNYTHIMRVFALFGPRLVVDHDNPTIWSISEQDPQAVQGWQCRAWNTILCAEKGVKFCRPITDLVAIESFLLEAKKIIVGREPLKSRFLKLPFSSDELSSQYPESKETSLEIYRAVSAYEVIEQACSVVGNDIDNDFH